ncbi:hypothetical protein HDU67_005688 [Dinochytrium kinnereticum]|nr:hypothetical protein HDU67_005688 [Dinochytrium kinnereticum]
MTETSLTPSSAKKLRVNDLKTELQKLGLPTSGKKEDLLARLLPHLTSPLDAAAPVDDGSILATTEVHDLSIPSVEVSTAQTYEQVEPIYVPVDGVDVANVNAAEPATIVDAPAVKTAPLTISSEEEHLERMRQRALRFGLPMTSVVQPDRKKANATATANLIKQNHLNDSMKKSPAPKAQPTHEELEAIKKRAERFGSHNPKAMVLSVEEEEKKRKRAERFGVEAAASGAAVMFGSASPQVNHSDQEAKAIFKVHADEVLKAGKEAMVKEVLEAVRDLEEDEWMFTDEPFKFTPEEG